MGMAPNPAPNPKAKPRKRTGGRPRPGVVALSSAAVLAVYSAGYVRTSSAAHRFDQLDAARVHAAPMVALAASPAALPALVTPGPESSPESAITSAPAPDPTPDSSPAPAVAAEAATPPPSADEALDIAPASSIAAQPSASEAPAETLAATASVVRIAPVTPAAGPAPVPAAATAPAPPAAAATLYKDGTYSGWGSCRHGDIQAQIVIAQGKITSARIQQCLTRYSCSWIAELPGQVVSRQSANVDYISGATQSSDAFYYAISQALQAALGK